MNLTIDELKELLPQVCARDTSNDYRHWNRANYLWGHQTVVSLFIRLYLGGEILVSKARFVPTGYEVNHYWNRLPDGQEVDLTHDQFCGHYKFEEPVAIDHYDLYDGSTSNSIYVFGYFILFCQRLNATLIKN